MKKILFFIFILIFNLSSFAEDKNEFKDIDTFKAIVTEKTHLNNQTKIKEYTILANLPDELKKVMISPEINKGEIYLYKGDNKKIYYPLLEQTIDQKITSEENYTLKFISDLKNYNKNSDFKVERSNGKINKIIYKDGVTIAFLDFQKIDNINFPSHIKVFDGESEVSELIFKDIKLNIKLSPKDFSIDEVIKK